MKISLRFSCAKARNCPLSCPGPPFALFGAQNSVFISCPKSTQNVGTHTVQQKLTESAKHKLQWKERSKVQNSPKEKKSILSLKYAYLKCVYKMFNIKTVSFNFAIKTYVDIFIVNLYHPKFS